MKDYVPLWDRLWQQFLAANRTLDKVLQSNITLYMLAVEAGDMVVYAKQCCVHRAEVVTAFTTHQGY